MKELTQLFWEKGKQKGMRKKKYRNCMGSRFWASKVVH